MASLPDFFRPQMTKVIATTELQRTIRRAEKALEELPSYALWTIEQFQSEYERDYELLWKHYGEQEVQKIIGEFELIWRGDAPTAGYIYCISDQQGHYKLGRSKQPQPRFRALGTQPPFKLTLLFTHYVYDAAQYEKLLHRTFAQKRLNGEWFELDDNELESIKSGKWLR